MEPYSSKIIGYHYTNPLAYSFMEDEGLIPKHKFVRPCEHVHGLSDEAYQFVTEGLLEAEPHSWDRNMEFPLMWKHLMYDICRKSEVMLLSFELLPSDEAFVVERGFVERELHKSELDYGLYSEAVRNCWESRVPVHEYDGSYSVPLLTIWSPIEFQRLNVEWVKSKKEVLGPFS